MGYRNVLFGCPIQSGLGSGDRETAGCLSIFFSPFQKAQMVLDWPLSSSGSAGWSMIEQAKEELQMLEAHHPHRFDYLKLELQSLVFLLESQNLQLPKNSTLMSCSAATTQASTTSKKRKKCGSEMQRRMESSVEACRRKLPRVGPGGGYMKRNDGVDAAIERAQACLRKIQQFKNQFLVI